MDPLRLVRRLSAALGPDATPEQVERLALAVLAPDDAPGESAAGGPAGSAASTRALVSAYGPDAPGILSALTLVVAEAGANVLDVSQKILQGYFTLLMVVDLAPARGPLADLQRALDDAGRRAGVRVLVQHEDLFHAMHRV